MRRNRFCVRQLSTRLQKCERSTHEDVMQLPRIQHFHLLILLLQFWRIPLESSAHAFGFNCIHSKAKKASFCAVPNAATMQTTRKTLLDCSMDCAFDRSTCHGFNHKEPQQICQKFMSPFTNLSLTPGCIYYEVRGVACISISTNIIEVTLVLLTKLFCITIRYFWIEQGGNRQKALTKRIESHFLQSPYYQSAIRFITF